MEELEDAKDKVMMGAERKSMVMSEDEKKLTAYHEAGHALVTLHEPASDPDSQGDNRSARTRARSGYATS
jgi:cell division protease FtsH